MEITDSDNGPDTIAEAIKIGYRHLDTAQKYGNESVVGSGIDRANVSREELFVATKIEETNLAYDDVLQTMKRSQDRLGLDIVDLLYVHWPAVTGPEDRYDPEATLQAFSELYDDGVIRHIGVANFSAELIKEAEEQLAAPILANQVEMHPHLQQEDLVEFAQDNDMYLVAYCPMMRGDIGSVSELRDIAEKHDATPGQVSIAWLMSKDNVVPIPKSAGPHLQENYRAQELELDSDDIERIDGIEQQERLIDAGKGPWNW